MTSTLSQNDAPAKPVRVMLVDDHDLLRQGLALFIKTRPDIDLVAQAATGEEAIDQCERYQPDVILMDLIMPDMTGVEATKIIRTRFPHIQIIALTSFDDDQLVENAIQAGAISYLLKNINTDKLAEAIHAAVKGQSTLSKEATQALISAARQPQIPHFDLTPRQYEVLKLMAEGKTNHEIAHELTISISTVKKHVSNILEALNTDSRTHATALAIQYNLIKM